MKVRLLVPRLADDGHRDRLWEFCRAHWERELPEYELVEGHHEGDCPFNRSAAINRAAEGKWDVAIVLDSDVVVDPGQVKAAVELAYETGELVLPFTDRNMLSEKGTEAILGGASGSWRKWVACRERGRVSCCVVVPHALWDTVGGFDERFEGWGGEDEAFHAACEVMGGAQRLDGAVWHLWHERSAHHDHSTPLYRQALALYRRYVSTTHPALMEQLLAESRTADQIALVVLTTGTRDTLEPTVASAQANLQGPIGRRLMVLDGPRPRRAELQRRYPDWDVVAARGAGTYPKAVTAAIEHAIGSGQPWIFWLEDDFTFDRPVDLTAMQAIVERDDLAQLSLKRQPWYQPEVKAGGIIEANAYAFTQRKGYVEHRAYWSMNPMLTRRSTLAAHHWPQGRDSELRFGRAVFSDRDARAGILGAIEDPPRVHHIGTEQAGSGY